MTRMSRKELKQDDLAAAASDAGAWVEQHWRSLIQGVGLALIVVLVALSWVAYSRHRREKSAGLLAVALAGFEKAEAEGFADTATLSIALGGLEQVAAGSGGGPGHRLARVYQGVALLRLGRSNEAVATLEQAAADEENPPTLAVTAKVMLAEAYAAAGRRSEAVALLTELTTSADGAYPASELLLRLGQLLADAGDREGARRAWQRVVDEHARSGAAGQARTLLAS